MKNNIFTTFQAAEICHASFMSINRWIHAGKLPAFKTPGGHHRILGKDLLAFMGENNIPITQNLSPARKRILIVDDDEAVRNAIANFMKLQNFEIAEAEDGFEAGVLVTQFMPELMILDLLMPNMDGFKVVEKIKTNPATKNIKIIVITGFGSEENIKKAYQCGADKVFEKPVPMEILLENIEELTVKRI